MSFNGSGLFSIDSAGQPVVASTLITAVAFNTLMADIATGLSTCIAKDGQTVVTANIPLAGFKLTGVGPGTARTDAATLANVQDSTGVYVATVGGTADAITLTPSPAIAAYAAGQTFRFIASGANTTAVTVAISGLASPKAITKNGSTALVAGDIPSGAMVQITYDGTRFILGPFMRDFLPLAGGTLTGALTTNGQVVFPASQNASADANTLDDYEEGTWTPAVGGSATYTFQGGRYTKIGSLVTVDFSLAINVLGTGSVSTISGLPFTVNNTVAMDPVGAAGSWASLAASYVFLNVRAPRNTTTLVFDGATAAAASLTSPVSLLQNGATISGSISYRAS